MSLITIGSADVGEYHGSKVPATARLYANKKFTTSEDVFIAQGAVGSSFYQEFTASLIGDKIRIDSGQAYSTTDSDTPDATYTLVIFDANGQKLQTVLTGVRIPPDQDPTTWDAIRAYSAARRLAQAPTYLNSNEILRMFDDVFDGAALASEVQRGVVKLDVAPADLSNPTALGANSPAVTALAAVGTVGRTKLDTAPTDPANPIAVGVNSPAVTTKASAAAEGKTKLSVAPADPANPVAMGANDPALNDIEKHLNGYINLATAISTIGATNTTLIIKAPLTVTSNTTLPPNIKLEVKKTGLITVNSGFTLTIGSMGDPGNRQVFAQQSPTANIRFSPGAVEKINLAWFVGATGAVDVSDALDQALASCSANGGGHIRVPAGDWPTKGDHDIPSYLTIEGAGSDLDSFGAPTKLTMTAAANPIFRLGSNTHKVRLKNMTIDGASLANVDGIYGEGSEPANDYAGEFTLENVTIANCVHGIRIHSTAGAWLVRAVHFIDCIFINNSHSAVRVKTVNNAMKFDMTNFGVPAGAWAFYIEQCGNVNISGSEFYGLGPYTGTRQVLTNTVVAAAGITVSGDARSVITGARVPGSPYTVTIPVTTALTTATAIATAFRTALNADPVIHDVFAVGGAGDDITLTERVPNANDGTANFTIEDVTSSGISDDVTANTTTSGVARTGMAEGVCHIGGSHGSISFESCQDEAFKYFIVNDASDIEAIVNIRDCLVQSEILFNQSFWLNSWGSNYLSRTFKEGTGNSTRINSFADHVRSTDAYGNAYSPPELTGLFAGAVLMSDVGANIDSVFAFRRPSKFLAGAVDIGFPSTPVLAAGHYSNVDEDKVLLRLGRTDVKGAFLYYYDLVRDYMTGRFSFTGSQSYPFKGYDFDADVRATQLSMSGSIALGSSGAVGMDCGASNRFTLTPTGDVTINASGIVPGKIYYITVLTTGTTSRNITFGTGFKSTGVLATGIVDAKYFVVEFYSPDSVNLIELRRTAAL